MPFLHFVGQYKSCLHCCHSLHGIYSESSYILPILAAGSVVIRAGVGPPQIGHKRRQKISDSCFGEQQQVSWKIQYSYCAPEQSDKKKTAVYVCADLNMSISLANASQRKSQKIYSHKCFKISLTGSNFFIMNM